MTEDDSIPAAELASLETMANRYAKKHSQGKKASRVEELAYSKLVNMGRREPLEPVEDRGSPLGKFVSVPKHELDALRGAAGRLGSLTAQLASKDDEIVGLRERLAGLEDQLVGIRPSMEQVPLTEPDIIDEPPRRQKHDTVVDIPVFDYEQQVRDQEKLQRYEDDLSGAREEVDSLRGANARLLGEHGNLKEELGQARAALIEAEEDKADAIEAKAAVERLLDELKGNMVSPEDEGRLIGDMFRKNEELYDEVYKTRCMLTDIFMKARQHKEGADAAEKELRISRFSQAAIDDVKTGKLEKARGEIDRYLEQIAQLEETVDDLEQSGADAAMAWAEAQENYELEQVKSAGGLFRIDQLEEVLTRRDDELRQAYLDLEDARADLHALNGRYGQLETNYAELNAQHAELEEERNSLVAATRADSEQLAAARAEVREGLMSTIEELRTEVAQAKAKVHEYESKMALEEKLMNNLKIELQNRSRDLARAQTKLKQGYPDAAKKDEQIGELEAKLAKAEAEIEELQSIQELWMSAREGVPSDHGFGPKKAGDYASAIVRVMKDSMLEADYSMLTVRFAEAALQKQVVHEVGLPGAFALVVDDYIETRKKKTVGDTEQSAKDMFAFAEGLEKGYAARAKNISNNFGYVPIAVRLLEPFVKRKDLEDMAVSVTVGYDAESVDDSVVSMLEDRRPASAMRVEEGYEGCPFYVLPVMAGKTPVAYIIASRLPAKEGDEDLPMKYRMILESFSKSLQNDYSALNLLYEQRKQLKALDYVAIKMKKAIGFLSGG